jgi:hypothetical protein
VIIFDTGDAWRGAKNFLRRHLKSKAVREAEKRRQGRKNHEAWRRTKRAAAVTGASGGGILAYTLALAPLGTTALIVAGGATLAAAGAALAWPGRAARETFSREELERLPGEAEDWLLDRREALPEEADPLLDRILALLGDIQPRLGELGPNSALAWEARRLIGDHLPQLVDAWCELPATIRGEDAEAKARLMEGLTTLAGELLRLCREISRDTRMSLETRARFVESRYKDGGSLDGE